MLCIAVLLQLFGPESIEKNNPDTLYFEVIAVIHLVKQGRRRLVKINGKKERNPSKEYPNPGISNMEPKGNSILLVIKHKHGYVLVNLIFQFLILPFLKLFKTFRTFVC